MNRYWNSVYGDHICRWLELKRKLNYKAEFEERILYSFDKFATRTGQSSEGITKTCLDQWSNDFRDVTNWYHYQCICILRDFSLFLNGLGIESFLPRLPSHPKHHTEPYVFSMEEMKRIFEFSNLLELKEFQPRCSINSFPIMLRVLYATGIRISEVVELKDDDLNLKEGLLHVVDSKTGIERLIPISATLLSACSDYLKYRDALWTKKKRSEFLFVRLDGLKIGEQALRNAFKECLMKAGVPGYQTSKLIRVHDLRHTFMVHALANMIRNGIDAITALGVLSVYVGHSGPGSTEYYLRLTDEMFPELTKKIESFTLDVFPDYHETN